MKCYVCGKKAKMIRTGNAVCLRHGSEAGFRELEDKALKDTFGDEQLVLDYYAQGEIGNIFKKVSAKSTTKAKAMAQPAFL